MNYKDFMSEIKINTENMSKEELLKLIYNIARKLSENNRKYF